LEGFNLMLYRFVEGHNGYEVPLSDEQWIEFGRALKQIHTTTLSPALMSRLPQETYSPKWRELVRDFQRRIEHETFADPIAAALAAFLNGKRDEVSALVERAERLSSALQTRTQEFVLCHTDIHVANLLIDVRDNALYIVDWDNPLLAPKERDLMFVGGGVFESARTLQEEESLFYQGYGQTEIDPVALAYYRYERIAQDIAAYCEQLLLTDEGGEDRAEGLRQLTSQFLPGGVIDVAYRSDRSLPREIQE
jgi:spectinomycin phosphotransferase